MIAGRDAKDVFIDALHLGMVFVAAFFSLACKNAMRSFILCFKGDPFTAYHESWGCVYLFSFLLTERFLTSHRLTVEVVTEKRMPTHSPEKISIRWIPALFSKRRPANNKPKLGKKIHKKHLWHHISVVQKGHIVFLALGRICCDFSLWN